jgi:hypothetical protein
VLKARLRTLHTVGNDREFILLRLVPSEPYVLAWDKLTKLIRLRGDTRKVGEALCGHALNLDRSPPFFAVPGLHGSLAQRFIHGTDNSHPYSWPPWVGCEDGGFSARSGFRFRGPVRAC